MGITINVVKSNINKLCDRHLFLRFSTRDNYVFSSLRICFFFCACICFSIYFCHFKVVVVLCFKENLNSNTGFVEDGWTDKEINTNK